MINTSFSSISDASSNKKSLTELIQTLVMRDCSGPLSAEESYQLMANTHLTPTDYAHYVMPSEDKYSRNRILLTQNIELLVLTWSPGQSCRIHDHQGSVCCIKVLEGTALEIRFNQTSCGKFIPTSSESFPSGTITASKDQDVHLVANTETSLLVTLHLYSPPLRDMTVYGIDQTVLS